jgi:putative transposase
MKIQSLNHSTYQHQYHIVWGTRYRRKFLQEYVRPVFIGKLFDIVKKYPGLHIENVNVDLDHVHLQIEIPPDTAVADAVSVLKSQTSVYLKKNFKFIDKMYLGGGIWSVGYFFSTIGLNEEQIRRYISYQGKKDYPTQTGFEFE